MRACSIHAALLLCVGCGATVRSAPGGAASERRERVVVAESAAPQVREPITISPVIVEAPAAICERPPTLCTDPSACATQIVDLEAHENWCAGSPATVTSAQIGDVSGLVAVGDAVWIQTDRGAHGWSGSAWIPSTQSGRDEGVPQLAFGRDVFRMPTHVVLTECVTPVVHCRRGGRKCAQPMPECEPIDEVVIAMHGPHATPLSVRNPLRDTGGPPVRSMGSEAVERLVAMAGSSASDVWILSTSWLFHWDGARATHEPLDAADPFVALVGDFTGVFARSRSGRRYRRVASSWQELPAQPGPFLGARVDAPDHPYVTLEHAQATDATSFWGIGHARTFGGRQDIAPAVVHYENGAYVTFIGALSQRSWLRADSVDVDLLRPEAFRVLVEDSAFLPGVFPFVTVRWQELRGLVRIADGPEQPDRLVVSTPVGIFGLEGGTWTREASGAFESMAARGDLVSAVGDYATVLLREANGWCPAMRPPPGAIAGLAVARERAWLAIGDRLYSVRRDHTTESFELRLHGHTAHIEQLLADGEDLLAILRGEDGAEAVASFDGDRWTTTAVGSAPFARVVGSSATAILTGSARFDGQCWTALTTASVPMIEVSAEERPVFSLVGDTEVELRMEIQAR